MTTVPRNDGRNEVLNSDLREPSDKNLTSIENVSRQYDVSNTPIQSMTCPRFIKRSHIEFTLSSPYDSQKKSENTNHYNTTSHPSASVVNLINIIEDIGYYRKSPFIYSSSNVHCQSAGNGGRFFSTKRLGENQQYFRDHYLDENQRSASLIEYNQVNDVTHRTTQKADDDQTNVIIHLPLRVPSTAKQMDDKAFQNHIQQMYGLDELNTISSTTSRRSSIDEKDLFTDQQMPAGGSETIEDVKPKQQITIREYFPRQEIPSVMVNRSISPSVSSQQMTVDDDYEQFFQNHPELFYDPTPEYVTKPNPDQVTYKQNVTVRYFVPPTPPPPGPLIIREILPPRLPTPPPIIIKQQDPPPPTPPPLILREAPPPPPPRQQAEVVTKVLPQQSPPSQPVVIERNPPLPPKPQSIIIEKWLPYKPAPPREVIYERITEHPVTSQFEPMSKVFEQQSHQSADFLAQSSSRVSIPVHIEQTNTTVNRPQTQPSTAYNQFVWCNDQKLQSMQHQVRERMQAQQQWIDNQLNTMMNMPVQIITPALVVHHPPVTRSVTSYARREEMQERVQYQPTFVYPAYS